MRKRLFALALVATCAASALLSAGQQGFAQSAQTPQTIEQLRTLRAVGDASPDSAQRLQQIEAGIAPDAPYPLRRELMLTRMALLGESLPFKERLATIQALRGLAEANGDANTVDLMDIRRILMVHADDDIGKYLGQLNEVRARIGSDASIEVMEALELSYGNLYFDAGNFDSALRHQLAALEWAEKLAYGSERARLFRLATIADLYNAMDLPDQALETIDRAFALPIDSIPLQNRISLRSMRTLALMEKGAFEEAESSLAGVEELAKQDGSVFTALRIGTIRADLLLKTAKPEKAIEAIDRVEALAEPRQNAYYLARAWLLRGHAYMQLNRIDHGLALMQKATDYFETKGQMVDVLDGLDRQIRTLRDKQLHGRALKLMEKRQQLWTQLFRNELGRAIAEVEAAHAARELETRVDALSIENRIQEERLRAETLAKALALVLALFAISLSAFLVFAIRRARKERDRLADVVRFDALTGASSRYQFQRRPARTTNVSVPSTTGLLLLDLDQFKSINDQHGHEGGDAVLKTVVARMRRVLASDDELYRWGGEEFLLVLNRPDPAALENDVLRLLDGIERTPVPWHGQTISIGVSGGYVRHPLAHGWQAPLSDAIRWADAALYLAKNSGRRRVEQVELTERGRIELIGRRPIDLPQLLDWQRRGYLRTRTLISPGAIAPVP